MVATALLEVYRKFGWFARNRLRIRHPDLKSGIKDDCHDWSTRWMISIHSMIPKLWYLLLVCIFILNHSQGHQFQWFTVPFGSHEEDTSLFIELAMFSRLRISRHQLIFKFYLKHANQKLIQSLEKEALTKKAGFSILRWVSPSYPAIFLEVLPNQWSWRQIERDDDLAVTGSFAPQNEGVSDCALRPTRNCLAEVKNFRMDMFDAKSMWFVKSASLVVSFRCGSGQVEKSATIEELESALWTALYLGKWVLTDFIIAVMYNHISSIIMVLIIIVIIMMWY